MVTKKGMLVMLVGLVALLGGMCFSSSGATVTIPNSSGVSGAAVQIPVNINDATGVAGFQFTITFDSSVLQATGAIAGSLTSLTSGWFIQVNTNVPGQISVIGASANPIPSGSGSLCIMQFNVVGTPASSTNLNFSVSKLSDFNAQQIVHSSQGGMFSVRGYYLTITINPSGGGTVLRNPDKTEYSQGDVVTLTATAAPGYRFDHWTGSVANPNSASTTITMNSDKTVTAYFVRQYTLTMAVNPQEAGTTSPAVGTRIYDEGTVVTLTATAAPGYRFDHWTGSVANPNSASTTITMNSDKTVTAVFNKIGFILELDRNVINSILKEQALTETKINVTITPIEGFSNTVNLSGEVFAESGISFAFTPSSGIPPFSSALTLTISGDTRPDTYLMRITGKSGDIENFQELIIVGNTLLYVPITYCSSQQDTGVEIPVIISNAKGLAGFQFEFSFDSNILRVTGVTNGSLTSNWLIMSDAKTPGLIKIAGLNPHLSGDSKEGSIVVINCEIIGEIPEQGVPLTLGNIKLSDSEANAIPVVKEDEILFPRIKGDLNGSGEVDIFDVILCLRQALEIDPKSMLADMNGNGEVDIFDVILLLRIVLEID